MELDSQQSYRLKLNDGARYELRDENDKVCRFSPPASLKGLAKLYVVSKKGKVLYVGISKQPVANRLRGGLKAGGKNGYWGYKWKGERAFLDFHVFTIVQDGVPIDLNDMEAIEAEVVFLYRLNTGQWPLAENEIHFQLSNATHRKMASEILTSIGLQAQNLYVSDRASLAKVLAELKTGGRGF